MRKSIKTTIWAATVAVMMQGTLYAGGYIAPVPVPLPVKKVSPSPWYLGAGLILLTYEGCKSSCEFEDKIYGMMLRGGYEYNQYIGVEARAMWANWETEGVELEHHVGIFLKPMLPVGEELNVYGLVGYGKTKIGGSREKAALDESGFSWGIGFEYDFSDKDDDYEAHKENENDKPEFNREFDGQANQETGWGIFLDYQQLLVDKQNVGGADVDLGVVSFGVTYDF